MSALGKQVADGKCRSKVSAVCARKTTVIKFLSIVRFSAQGKFVYGWKELFSDAQAPPERQQTSATASASTRRWPLAACETGSTASCTCVTVYLVIPATAACTASSPGA